MATLLADVKMSFLLGDDYASSSESESDEEEVESGQMRIQESTKEEKRSEHFLPSPDSVLSSVSATTASFLPPKSKATVQSTVKSFNLLDDREAQGQEPTVQDSAEKVSKPEQKATAETLKSDHKRRLPLEVAPREPLSKREKKGAKERVKGQRLKGQAGIGSDFRGWKSETEMSLRQQFD